MAQIKKIVKPGDLIRGASVGLAGLDKDGNVVGYKAAATDAGKVLTVGEDGSVAPAEGGGGSTLYRHDIFFTADVNVGITIINNDPTPFNDFSVLGAYMKNKGWTGGNAMIPATGYFKQGDEILIAIGAFGDHTNSPRVWCFNLTSKTSTNVGVYGPRDTVTSI